MLEIGVDLHHASISTFRGVAESAAHRRTHPDVYRQPNHGGAARDGLGAGGIDRAVVDDQRREADA